MSRLIDDEGNLLGVVNVVDALVVLLLLAVVVAGVGLVWNSDSGAGDRDVQSTTTIEFRSTQLQPYVVASIDEGPVAGESVVSVHNKSVEPSQVVTQDDSGNLSVQRHPVEQTVTLTVELPVTRDGEQLSYGDGPLQVGRELDLNLGRTTVSGQVVAVNSTS